MASTVVSPPACVAQNGRLAAGPVPGATPPSPLAASLAVATDKDASRTSSPPAHPLLACSSHKGTPWPSSLPRDHCSSSLQRSGWPTSRSFVAFSPCCSRSWLWLGFLWVRRFSTPPENFKVPASPRSCRCAMFNNDMARIGL